MKVLYVTPYVPSLIRVRPYNFVRSLGRLGHEVTVLCVTDGSGADGAALEELRGMAAAVETFEVSRSRSARNCVAALTSGEPLQAAFSYHPEMEARARALVRTGTPDGDSSGFDVVQVEHLRASRILRAIDRERQAAGGAGPSVPLVFDSVDSISLLFEQAARSGAQLRTRVIASLELSRTRRHEAQLLTHCDAAVVTSRLDKEALEELAEQFLPAESARAPVSVVTNGVDLEYFRPLGGRKPGADGPGAHPTVIISGKMSYHANVAAALHFAREVLPLVWAEDPDVRFQIVGKDPPEAVRQLSADERVEVTGEVADLRPYVGRATVAVCPVRYAVGIQNKVLEAMAMGTPVVTTSTSLGGLQVRAGQDLLVGDDPAEFAAEVLRVCRDRELAADLCRAGRDYVERSHDWSRQAAALVEVYERAAESRRQIGAAAKR